jgi:hypothetical protein
MEGYCLHLKPNYISRHNPVFLTFYNTYSWIVKKCPPQVYLKTFTSWRLYCSSYLQDFDALDGRVPFRYCIRVIRKGVEQRVRVHVHYPLMGKEQTKHERNVSTHLLNVSKRSKLYSRPSTARSSAAWNIAKRKTDYTLAEKLSLYFSSFPLAECRGSSTDLLWIYQPLTKSREKIHSSSNGKRFPPCVPQLLTTWDCWCARGWRPLILCRQSTFASDGWVDEGPASKYQQLQL